MNDKAEVLNKWFGRTVIYSDARFAYEEAHKKLSNHKKIPSQVTFPSQVKPIR